MFTPASSYSQRYNVVASLRDAHGVYLVQHAKTGKLYVQKATDIYNLQVYAQLYRDHIAGTPEIIEYYEEGDKLIVIEEYISGTSLQELIQNGELTKDDISQYMLDLCVILEQLHSFTPAIIHRDIKPSNIIITKYNRAVLLDFNAAKFYTPEAKQDTVLLGTQGYAAPEQYGFGTSSPQTDIYSLGILLKEMLESTDIPADAYERILKKCTHVDPHGRYKSVRELKYALKPDLKSTKYSGWRKFLPPGFRSGTPWKMILATAYYIFFAWSASSDAYNVAPGLPLFITQFSSYLISLSWVFLFADYMGCQKLAPFHHHENGIVRFAGMVLLLAGVDLLLIMFGVFIERIAPLHP